MPISLQNLAETGELAYIGKHNANIDALRAFLDSMESTLNSVSSSASSPINAINIGKAAFGPSGVVLVGVDSYAASTAGSNLTLQPGFYWNGGTAQMFYKSSATVLGFTGQAAATYYITMDATGLPQISTTSAGAMYSVVWTGSAFGTITQLATYAPGYQDFLDMLSSAYSGITYETPDARLEAIEKAISAEVTANVASGDVTLTDVQAMEAAVIKITGAPAAVRNVIVPTRAKLYGVRNTATGGFDVTVKTSAGTGVALADGEGAILHCDGVNVVLVLSTTGGGGASTFTALTDTPASYSGQANKIVKVKADESGLEFDTATAPGVFTGLTDAPSSYSGQALKVPRVNAGETALEFFALISTFLGLTDTPSSYAGSAYRVLSVNGAETALEFTAAATPSAFLGLTDTPSSYASSALKYVRVNSGGTALEFVDGTAGGATDFVSLTDTPSDYTGSNGYFVKVNSAGNALEFVDSPLGSFVGLSDTPASLSGAALKVLTVSGDELSITFSDLATPTSFVGLTDTPASYSGQGGKVVKVNSGATALEFATEVSTFLQLTDTPSTFSGQALKGIRVNAAGTALEFYDEPAVIGVAWNGAPGADEVLGLFTAPFAIDFAAAMAGSSGITLTAATAQTDIAVDKIEAGTLTVTAVGTVRFAAAGTAPTFIAASAFSLAAGDALRFKAPTTPDATLANFSFSIVGSK